MPAKAHSETGRPATNGPGNRNELERNAPVQERRPFHLYFQFFAQFELMPGIDQRATTTQIHNFALSQAKPSAKSAVADLQHQRVARLRPPLHQNQLQGRC